MGGDEFAIAITEIRGDEDAGRVAHKIIQALGKKFCFDGLELHIGASIGISTYPQTNKTLEGLFKCADLAMYRAKELGRNHYQYFSQELHNKHAHRLSIENAITHAIERKELSLVYQPQYNMQDMSLVGLEALIRWNNKDLGMVRPDIFIPIAESCGQILNIGSWVLEEGCRQYAEWEKAGVHIPRLAINISQNQLDHTDVIDQTTALLDQYAINPINLEFEITETALMRHEESSQKVIKPLADIGIKLSIDDFGTGYSSLLQLKNHTAVETLKIDREFIKNVDIDKKDAMIAKTIIDMAHNLGLEVIAEGVERQSCVDFLLNNGCSLAQGYLFNKPLVAEQIIQIVK